jgi:hypothetical protein
MARKPKKTTTPTRRKTTPPTAKVKRQQIAAETEAKAMATLAPLAKEINHRLEQASKLVDDAYDHRLAAALQLDKAKKLAEKRKINFQQWCKENVSHGYENVRKLVAVGGASNPKRALEDLRGRVNEASKKSRAKLKKKAKSRGNGFDGAEPSVIIHQGFDVMNDTEAVAVIRHQAERRGLTLALAKDEDDGIAALVGLSVLDQMKALFVSAPPADQMKAVHWMVEQVGATLADPFMPAVEKPKAAAKATSTRSRRVAQRRAQAEARDASVDELTTIPANMRRV